MPAIETSGAGLQAPTASTLPSSLPPLFTLHDVLWLFYLYPIRWLALVLPRGAIYALAKLAEPIVQFHTRRGQARSVPWIEKACAVSTEQARRICRQSVSNKVFRFIDELLLLRPSGRILSCAGIDGLDHLNGAIARGRGVILLVGHFCAIRIGARYLAMQSRPALLVRNRRPPNRREGRFGRRFLQPRSSQLQEMAYPDQVFIQDRDCSLKILQRLRAGGLVVIQMDGHGGTAAVEHPLLGRPWRAPSGIFEIIRLSNCAVVPMLCLGRSDGFQIRFDPMLEVEHAASRAAAVSANLHRFMATLEKQVIEHSEEWTLWNHF